MRDLTNEDIGWAVSRLPKPLRKCFETEVEGGIIAGGYLRSIVAREDVNDIDVFVSRDANADAVAGDIRVAYQTSFPIHRTANALTLIGTSPPVQLIHRWRFKTLDECLESFDFTIAAAGLTCVAGSWSGRCHDQFYEDLAAKRLRYTSPNRDEEVGGSFLRLLKFYGRGYRAPLESSAAVVARLISKIKDTRLAEQDSTQVLKGLLLEVDPAVTDGVNPVRIARRIDEPHNTSM